MVIYVLLNWLVLSKIDWLSCIETKDGSNEKCLDVENRSILAIPLAITAYISLLLTFALPLLIIFQTLRINSLSKGSK